MLEDFWTWFLNELRNNPDLRGIVAGGLIWVLAYAKAVLCLPLKLLSTRWPSVFRPEGIPPILSLVGLLLGLAVGHLTGLPRDLTIAIGTGAGAASGSAYELFLHKKKGETRP